MESFNLIQTFYVDAQAALYSSEVFLSSIELFFRNKPQKLNNTSGTLEPGVSVFLCEVENNLPVPEKRISAIIRKDWDSIFPFSDASTPTVFNFPGLVSLKTDRFYGIAVKFEDAEFVLWQNKQDDFLLNTNTRSSGSTQVNDGKYFEATNSTDLKALSDRDLKFKVNVAKFEANTVSQFFTNKNYEFLSVSNAAGQFQGGELVFQVETADAGTVSVNQGSLAVGGSGTTFTNVLQGTYIVVKSGVEYDVLYVDSVLDDTNIVLKEPCRLSNSAAQYFRAVVGKVYDTKPLEGKLTLTDSSANTTLKFDTGATIRGEISTSSAVIASVDNLDIDNFLPNFSIQTNSKVDTDISFSIAKDTAGNIAVANTYLPLVLGKENSLESEEYLLLSRSNEVSSNTLFENKSSVFKVDFNVSTNIENIFSAPRVSADKTSIFVGIADINSTTESLGFDTEVGKNGIGKSRYIGKKLSFESGRYAEDIRVYSTAYRPIGTEVKVYAKVHNSADEDAFDDKAWTPLELKENKDVYSADKEDLIEYTYGFAAAPETELVLGGSFNTQLANNVVQALEITPNTYLAAGDLIKIQSPLFPENYHVSLVNSANTTAIVINTPIPDSSVSGSGFKVEKLKYPKVAFNNARNDGIVRYFNSTGAIFDTYNSFQIKIVLTAINSNISPEVESIQTIGISV
jgi:hypothetical protein